MDKGKIGRRQEGKENWESERMKGETDGIESKEGRERWMRGQDIGMVESCRKWDVGKERIVSPIHGGAEN